ncbi:Ig-like domain-containing protein [Fibrobacter sp. UWT2]|uniref:Ig-like domain-containing domain n=1 Tax=Fibrobacter sp. UWT2 TaxID=1896224 RepID=UPI0009222CA3|nr:Ig-like domain-containing domain [Fibrobacter sp. UWT2]SHL32012.1 Ig-like domain-containing protein [Fibrobacter sp. UWT2]
MKFSLLKYGAVVAGLVSALLVACATQVAPSGGPEDKLPPRVAGVYPAPYTTNHPNELMVKLEFDEWINASIPRSAVSISPPIDKKLRFEVSGKTLVLSSRAVLDTGTTYTITFAGGIKDLHGNALAKPFQVVFSTGAIIDSLTVSGRVLVNQAMARKKEYPSIGLFLLGEDRASKHYLEKYRDTTTKEISKEPQLLKEPPLYVTRADSAGHFTLTGLKAGHYRVVAFVDGNGNQKIELSTEQVGLWTGDLNLTAETTDTLWIAVADMDTTKLELESVNQPFANVLEASFTRGVYFDSAFADTANCHLTSPENKKLYPKLVYLGASSSRPQFYFDPAPKSEVLYKFVCDAAKDSLFRPLDTLRNEVEWEWKKMEADTLPPKVSGVKTNSKAKSLFPDDSLIVYFNKPKLDSLTETFYIAINKDTTQVQVKQLDPVRFAVEKTAPWQTDMSVNFLMGYMDTTLAAADSNGKRDTVIELKYTKLQKFETVSKLKLAKLKGRIPNANPKTMVRLLSAETNQYYQQYCNADGSFSFGDLVEGNYLMDYYFPEEGKDLPDAGSVEPLRYGSAWRAISDTLKVKNGENALDSLVKEIPAL